MMKDHAPADVPDDLPAYKWFIFYLVENVVFIYFLLSSRYFHWNLALYLILFMVIVILPFYISYFIMSNVSFGKLFLYYRNIQFKNKYSYILS